MRRNCAAANRVRLQPRARVHALRGRALAIRISFNERALSYTSPSLSEVRDEVDPSGVVNEGVAVVLIDLPCAVSWDGCGEQLPMQGSWQKWRWYDFRNRRKPHMQRGRTVYISSLRSSSRLETGWAECHERSMVSCHSLIREPLTWRCGETYEVGALQIKLERGARGHAHVPRRRHSS